MQLHFFKGEWRRAEKNRLTRGPATRSCECRIAGAAFGGAPLHATSRARGVPTWGGCAMGALPLGPS
eukprot:6144720-Pyramimonas_sp.AAC.1